MDVEISARTRQQGDDTMTVTKAIARTWTDAVYKAKLLSDPHAALTPRLTPR